MVATAAAPKRVLAAAAMAERVSGGPLRMP
jgi:hypothetical protein